MKKWITMIMVAALCCGMLACTASEGTTPAATLPTTTQPTAAPTTLPVTQPTTVPPTTQPDPTGLGSKSLKLGSQMPDFTIVDTEGNSYTLYELLEEKKAVVLNFWFINCPYCVMEFPVLGGVYEQFRDSAVLLAVTPYDAKEDIVSFKQANELNFAMCEDEPGLARAFGIAGYPTTVVIDRYGVVCLIHEGAVTSTQVFTKIFSYFTAEDYVSKPLNSYLQTYK